MTDSQMDAPERITVDWDEKPRLKKIGTAWESDLGDFEYILATSTVLAADPAVKALVDAAVAAERERCVAIAVRHWEGEPEDTIAMVAEMRAGMNPLTDYERKVAQMREDFPNGI